MKNWRTLGISLVVALALLLAMHGTASALVENLTIDELTAKADSILVGEVTDVASYEEGKGNIYTLVTLSVEQTIKGKPGNEVVLRVPGGEVDGLGLWVEDAPSFQLRERAVVFLEEVAGTFEVSGWYQGKFTIQNNRVAERNQSLPSFVAEISQAMEAQGMTPSLSVKPSSVALKSPLESVAVEPAVTGEFQTGWENIMTDGFESGFPGSTWALGGTPTWDDESYRSRTGTYSVWCAGSTLTPPSNYANNMNAWMVYGPFSLVGTTDADLTFYLWLESLANDAIYALASINGSNFYGSGWSGSSSGSWAAMEFDLTSVPTLGNLCGQSQVWVAFVFQSDSSGASYGAFIDDVVLRKYVSAGSAPQITSISPNTGSAGTGFQVTITGTDFGATQGSSTVTFWRVDSTYVEATDIVSWSNTQIVCEVPSGASSGTDSNGVKVTTPDGPSNNKAFAVTFSYSGQKWFGANPMGETFEINENTDDTDGEGQAIINAAQAWSDVDGANFSFEYGGSTSATDYSGNDHNEIMWVNYNTGSIATSWRWYNPSTGQISECDIVFNDLNYNWYANGTPGSQMDVQNIGIHELGHWLCLLDLYGSADSDKTMYGYGSAGETKKRTPEAEDKAGIRWIYSNWDSYKGNYGDSGGTQEDDFDDFSTEHTVYMYGTSFNGTYEVIYWDGDGDKRVGESVSSIDGKLRTSRTFNPGEGTPGDWHATVYTQSADPSSYSAADLDIVADDKSYTGDYAFHLEQSAVPEFPTVLAAVAALALCTGIYLWQRRKVAPRPA